MRLHGVPVYVQERYQCGPAALAMAMAAGGGTATPEDLGALVFSPIRKGSLQPSMVAAARRSGFLAHPVAGVGALYAEVAAGHPVVVLENLGRWGRDRWHYSVVVGLAPYEGRVWLHDGTPSPVRRSLRDFLGTWAAADHWGLVVLPPGRLPAAGDERAVIDSIAGLERAGRSEEAVRSYRAAVRRWPESPGPRMGLGNALYGAGRREEAASVFRSLCEASPPAASGCNNLAHILMEEGRHREAREAARKAVSLGGPLLPVYRETLRSIPIPPTAP